MRVESRVGSWVGWVEARGLRVSRRMRVPEGLVLVLECVARKERVVDYVL